MPRFLKFRERLDRYPPILIRVLTWSGRGKSIRFRTDRELADACGLTMAEFLFVSYSTRWEGPAMAYLEPYLAGCEVDLENQRCIRRLHARRVRGCKHLGRSPLWPQIEAMLTILESDENK